MVSEHKCFTRAQSIISRSPTVIWEYGHFILSWQVHGPTKVFVDFPKQNKQQKKLHCCTKKVLDMIG